MKSLVLQLAGLPSHTLSREPRDLKAAKRYNISLVSNQGSSLLILLKSTPPARMLQLLTLHLDEPKAYTS